MPNSDTFVSASSEHDLVFWKIDKAENKIVIMNEYVIGRHIMFFNILEDRSDWQENQQQSNDSKAPTKTDRIWLGFEHGD